MDPDPNTGVVVPDPNTGALVPEPNTGVLDPKVEPNVDPGKSNGPSKFRNSGQVRKERSKENLFSVLNLTRFLSSCEEKM